MSFWDKKYSVGSLKFDGKWLVIAPIIVGLVMAFTVVLVWNYQPTAPHFPPVFEYPAERNQWCSNVSDFVVFKVDVQLPDNTTENAFFKANMTIKGNNDTSIPIDWNETFYKYDGFVWESSSPFVYEWIPQWSLFFPLNASIEPFIDWMIPFAYNNYSIMKAMLNQSIFEFNDTQSWNYVLNWSVSCTELPFSALPETEETSGYYDGEYILDGTYLGVRYDVNFVMNETVTADMDFIQISYIFEAHTGMSLYQTFRWEYFEEGYGFHNPYIFSWKTLTSSTVLQTV